MVRRLVGRVAETLDGITQGAVFLLTSTMVVTVLTAVFFRYVLMAALTGSEEFARYTMIWSAFLSAGLAVRRKAHIGMEALVQALPPKVHGLTNTVANVITTAFLCALVYYGSIHSVDVWSQRSPALRIPMTWPFLSIPVGGFLMLVQYIAVLLGLVAPELDERSLGDEDGSYKPL